MKHAFYYGLALTIAAVACFGYLWRGRASGPVNPDRALQIYCSVSLRYPVSRLAKTYGARHGIEIDVIYGSPGALVRDVAHRKSGDLLLVSDLAFLSDLRQISPDAQTGETWPLATLRPVVAVLKDNPRHVKAFDDLLRPDIKTSIPKPQLSGIGRVARDHLNEYRWKAIWDHRMSDPDSSSASGNDVKLGVVDAGLVWRSTLREFPELEGVEVAEFAEIQGRAAATRLSWSKNPTVAKQFAEYLADPQQGGEVFSAYGLGSVPSPSKAATSKAAGTP